MNPSHSKQYHLEHLTKAASSWGGIHAFPLSIYISQYFTAQTQNSLAYTLYVEG